MVATYRRPGVYLTESLLLNPADVASTTTVAAFVGLTPKGPPNQPVLVDSWSSYVNTFGGFQLVTPPGTGHDQGDAIHAFRPVHVLPERWAIRLDRAGRLHRPPGWRRRSSVACRTVAPAPPSASTLRASGSGATRSPTAWTSRPREERQPPLACRRMSASSRCGSSRRTPGRTGDRGVVPQPHHDRRCLRDEASGLRHQRHRPRLPADPYR